MLTRRIAPLVALAATLALPLSVAVATPASAATFIPSTWDDLTSAAATADSGDTIVLAVDILADAGEQLVIDSPKAITLDLNGRSLTITDPGVDRAAVQVPNGASLTINDSAGGGALTATGGPNGAGIGGGLGVSSGAVTINSGAIIATGGNEGAGIGGGDSGDGGAVTINGGTVAATGGLEGAGIGGGARGDGGAVTINGGTITATGGGPISVGGGGAGIGGGRQAADGGTLAINGTPDPGNATTGGNAVGPSAGLGADPITNPTTPTGVGYSAVTSVVGLDAGRIVVVFNYLITFDGAGGSATTEQTVNEGDTVTEPADPTRSGFAFAGWHVGGAPYDFSTPVTNPVTVTAAWTPVLAETGADQGLFLPAALALLLMGGTLVMLGRARRA